MSKRGCILGNSHMAAFVTAAHQGVPDGITLDYFGAHRDVLDAFEVCDGWFRSADEDSSKAVAKLVGRSEFCIEDYDFFVVTGLHFSIFQIVRVFREFSSIQMTSINSHLDAMDYDRTLATGPMLRDYATARLSNTLGGQLAAKLTAASSGPVFVASQPRPSIEAVKLGGKYAGFKQLEKRGEGQFVSDFYQASAAQACEALGAHFIDQPGETTQNGIFTRAELMVGSTRLSKTMNISHEADDVIHANADFGAQMIAQIAARLS